MALTVLSISFNHISFLENDLKEAGDTVTLILVVQALQNRAMKTHPPEIASTSERQVCHEHSILASLLVQSKVNTTYSNHSQEKRINTKFKKAKKEKAQKVMLEIGQKYRVGKDTLLTGSLFLFLGVLQHLVAAELLNVR